MRRYDHDDNMVMFPYTEPRRRRARRLRRILSRRVQGWLIVATFALLVAIGVSYWIVAARA